MLKKKSSQSLQEFKQLPVIAQKLNQWFSVYFHAFIEISAGRTSPEEILKYWGVPLHSSGPAQSKWLKTAEEVIQVLQEMQAILKSMGYTHTVILDKRISIYNENAGRVETIMSRRAEDDIEVDRAAVSFELRGQAEGWIIISTTSLPTVSAKLDLVWPQIQSDE